MEDRAIPDTHHSTDDEVAARIDRERDYLFVRREAVFPHAPVQVFMDRVSEDPPEGEHPHAVDYLEIAVVSRGTGVHLTALGAHPLRPGTVIVMRPGAWQSARARRDFEAAFLCLSTEALATDLSFLRERPGARELLYAARPESRKGVWITQVPPAVADEVVAELERLEQVVATRSDQRLLVIGQTLVALGILVGGLGLAERDRPMHPAVLATLESLDRAPETSWDMAKLARAVNLDPAYLARLFRTQIGVPPITYLARLRAERAARLLADPLMPIARVGAEVGWADGAQFSRRFRALLGMSPSQYRRRLRSGEGRFEPSR